MSISDKPHYRIEASELANWLEAQGVERWWTTDGEYRVVDRLFLPAPADEFAAVLRRINRPLLVEDRRANPLGRGEQITARDLDALAVRPWDDPTVKGPKPASMNDRVFFLRWEDEGDDWMLLEDEEYTQGALRDAAEAQESK
jgi:hypothetical protein